MIMKLPEQETTEDGDRKHRKRTTAKAVDGQDSTMDEQRKEKVANFPHHKRVADYLLGKCVGEGSFAKVRLGLHAQTGEEVAVKVMSKARARKDAYVHKNLRREGRILQMARHANIVQVYDILETDNNYYLVTEFCRGGELIDMVTEKGCLPENDVRRYMTQLASAVSHLHAHGIVHRDLKVENLLLNENGNLKIIDFGLSNIISGSCTDSTRALATQCGSPAYAAPELLAKNKYGPKVDVWSIGVITYALLVGKLPFTVEPFRIPKLCRKMLLGDMNPIPAHLSGNCRHFIRRLLVPDPDIRPSISQVMKMIWISTNSRTTTTTPSSVKGIGHPISRNDDMISSPDIDSEVVRELTNKFDFEYSEIVNCVRKNRPGEVLTTYYLVSKQKYRNRDLKCKRNTDVIGSDGNLDHGHESDSKSSDDEVDGLNDVDDDVTDGIIFTEVFKEKKMFKKIVAETDATKLDGTANPQLFCNDIIIDEIIKRYTDDQEKSEVGKDDDDVSDHEKTKKSKQVEIRAANERHEAIIEQKVETGIKRKDEYRNGSSNETEIGEPVVTDKPQVQVDTVEKSSGKLMDSKSSKSGKTERKSRGPSSMRDFVKTMSRAREVLQRRGRFGSTNKSSDKKKNVPASPAPPAQVGKFTRLSSTNDEGVDNRSQTSNEKTTITSKRYDYKSSTLSRNLWNNYSPSNDRKNAVNTRLQLPDAPPPTTPILQQRPRVSASQWHNVHCPPSPSSGYTTLRLFPDRRSTSPMTTLERERAPHRISTFRGPNGMDISIGSHGTSKSPDCMFPRITVDRPSRSRDPIANLTPSNLTPRYNYTATPRSSLTSDMTSRAVSSGVKDIIDRFHALLHDDNSPKVPSKAVTHRSSEPATPAMAYLSSNGRTMENLRHNGRMTSPQSQNHSKYMMSPKPYGSRRYTQPSEALLNDSVPKTNTKTFSSHFGLMETQDSKKRFNDVLTTYHEKTENDFKSTSPIIWYKSAV